jgi:hypothetical protein
MHRAPLTAEQRAELDDAATHGNRAGILHPSDDCPTGVLFADPGKRPHGVVVLADDQFTPDEARRIARALLELADWAEFGPGEWASSGEWQPWDRTR